MRLNIRKINDYSYYSIIKDYGIVIQPTRIDRSLLRTVSGIEQMIEEYLEKEVN